MDEENIEKGNFVVTNEHTDSSRAAERVPTTYVNHNTSSSSDSSSSSHKVSAPFRGHREYGGDDGVIGSGRGSEDVSSLSSSQQLNIFSHVDANNDITAGHSDKRCYLSLHPTLGSAYRSNPKLGLGKNISSSAGRLDLPLDIAASAAYSTTEGNFHDKNQTFLLGKAKSYNDSEKKRKREKLQYVNYVKKSRDAAKSTSESAWRRGDSASGNDLSNDRDKTMREMDACKGSSNTADRNSNIGSGSGSGSNIRNSGDIHNNFYAHAVHIDTAVINATAINHFPSSSSSFPPPSPSSLAHFQTNVPHAQHAVPAASTKSSPVHAIFTGSSSASGIGLSRFNSNNYDVSNNTDHFSKDSIKSGRTVSLGSAYGINGSSIGHSLLCSNNRGPNGSNSGSNSGGRNTVSMRSDIGSSDMEVSALLLAMSGNGSGASNSQSILPSLLPAMMPIFPPSVQTVRHAAHTTQSHSYPFFSADIQQNRGDALPVNSLLTAHHSAGTIQSSHAVSRKFDGLQDGSIDGPL